MKRAIAAIEASYAAVPNGDVDAWICRTVDALAPILGEGAGTLCYRYDARGMPKRWSITEPVVVGGPAELAFAVTSTFAAAPASLLVPLYRAEHRAATASEIQGFTFDRLEIGEAAAFARKLGVLDLVSLNAGDPSGRGAIFAAACARRRSLRPAERWSFARLASHLAAAHRLVTAVQSLTPAATFAAGGRLLEANAQARRDAQPLRAAVRDMERARMRATGAEDALALWQGLVLGRYSLVDRFESDGKRFVIAYENAPEAADPRGLTARERAVAGLLALALPDKLIAYELGLGEGTVRAHVHAVLEKLGVASRAEAVSRLMPPAVARTMKLGPAGPDVVVFADELHASALDALSVAEREVATLAARGVSTRAIATKRGKTPGTVAKQLASAFAKLGVRSRAELAALVSRGRGGAPR